MAAFKKLFLLSRQVVLPVLTKELNKNGYLTAQRCFSVTVPSCLKEIHVRTENDVTVVEGTYIDSDRKGKVLELDDENAKDFCPLCPNRLNVQVKYTDVLILSQFVRPDGCLLPRQVTGLCKRAQRRLQRLVHQAQRAGLMPELRPPRRDGNPQTLSNSTYKWRKYNTYYDE